MPRKRTALPQFTVSTHATLRDDTTTLLMAQIDVVVRMVCAYADGVMLSEVVAGGPAHWRVIFGRAFRAGKGLPAHSLDDLADNLFLFFSSVHIWKHGHQVPRVILDAVEEVMPPTQKEIAAAWEIDSASSEDGRRYMYGPGGPEQALKELRDMPVSPTKQ
ncbi:MAG: hypothetical protein H0W42_03075 [Gemmatimonadaceae bacterium]|nr:hypothetical protein [Gemmatimonadaceae bacterium]